MIENADAILRSIALGGAASQDSLQVNHIIGGNLNHILNLTSGTPRLHGNVEKKFKLILSQPEVISVMNPFEIRCALCRTVISYPSWYYDKRYAINHFHYFVCFDSASSLKPSARCYRKS